MPVSSNWPLQPGAVRFFVPHFAVQTLAQHALSRDLVLHGVGYYPKAYGHQMARSSHEDHLLLYCSAGKGLVRVGRQEFRVGKGDLVVLPQGWLMITRPMPAIPGACTGCISAVNRVMRSWIILRYRHRLT